MDDDRTVEEISPADCLELLRTSAVGRVGGTVAGHPFVLPVNYAVDGDQVVFKTAAGTKLSGSSFARVAFEIDGFDAKSRTGWSVVVEGVATDISDMIDTKSSRLRALDLQPWFAGEKSHWVAIQPESISGRRVVPGA